MRDYGSGSKDMTKQIELFIVWISTLDYAEK